METEVFNAKITATALTAEKFAIQCGTLIDTQEGYVNLTFETDKETIAHILAIAEAECWEQLIGKPVRIKMVYDGNQWQITDVGHLLADSWLNIGTGDEEKVEAEEISVDEE